MPVVLNKHDDMMVMLSAGLSTRLTKSQSNGGALWSVSVPQRGVVATGNELFSAVRLHVE